jgi:hypothetical protein
MDWTTVYTVTTKQGDFVGNRYSEDQALLFMRICNHTHPENAPHQLRTWHEMKTQHTFATSAARGADRSGNTTTNAEKIIPRRHSMLKRGKP